MQNPTERAAEHAVPSVSPNVPAPPREMSPNVPGCPPMSANLGGRKTNPPCPPDVPRYAGEPRRGARKISPITRFVLETAVMETFANMDPLETARNAVQSDRTAQQTGATVSPNVPARGPEMSPDVPSCRPMSPNASRRKTNPPPPTKPPKLETQDRNPPDRNPPDPEPPSPRPPAPPVDSRGDDGPPSPHSLTPLQLAAARAFAKGGRTLAIAEALRISRRTLSRWQRLPAFRAEIERVH